MFIYACGVLRRVASRERHGRRRERNSGGCERCRHTGYQGRAALFEICLVTPALQEMISQGKPGEFLRAKALQEGMVPLRQDGWSRVIAGTTTVEEVMRVTSADVNVLDE